MNTWILLHIMKTITSSWYPGKTYNWVSSWDFGTNRIFLNTFIHCACAYLARLNV